MTDRAFNEAVAEQISPTRRKILLALKRSGAMTAAELADHLGITGMGVRRHLTALERDELVQFESQRRGQGRPSHLYELTERAENLFPKNYASLVNELLGYLTVRAGEPAVRDLFDQRAQRRIQSSSADFAGKSLIQQVSRLAEILTGEGYLAEWQQIDPDTFLLSENNCAVHDVAKEFRAACASELVYLQTVLPDAVVTREHHLLAGGQRCTYRVARRGLDSR